VPGKDYGDLLASLAATHAALDPQRRRWRNDILISAIVEILSRRISMSVSDLLNKLAENWVTSSIDKLAVLKALEAAAEEGLVHHEQRDRRRDIWRVSDGARAEAVGDRKWVDQQLAQLERGVRARLDERHPGLVQPKKVPHLTRQLLGAMVAASDEVFSAVVATGSPQQLRAVQYSLHALGARIVREVTPPEVGQALAALALAAADPDDSFGDELLALVVAGQILHAILVRKDLSAVPPVTGVTLFLDTSALVHLLGIDDAAEELLRSVIKDSQKAGSRIVITSKVVEEWESLWVAAAKDLGDLELAGNVLSPSAWSIMSNPVLKAYAKSLSVRPTAQFAHFSNQFRDLRARLYELGVEEEPNRAASNVDESFLNKVRDRLLSERSDLGAEVDGTTAAYVAAIRDASRGGPLPAAWMVALDRRTDEAYRELRPDDDFPLVVSPGAWLLYLSNCRHDDPAGRASLVRELGQAVVSESFLAVATGYTDNDRAEIAELFAGGPLTAADARDAIRANFVNLEQDASSSTRMDNLTRLRNERRDDRAFREVFVAQKQAEAARVREREAHKAAEAAASKAGVRKKEANAATAEANRLRRQLHVAVASGVVLIGAVVTDYQWALSTSDRVALVAGAIAACAVGGREYVEAKRGPLRTTVVSLLALVAVTVAGSALGTAMSESSQSRPLAPPHSSPSPGR
jgi:hypothetical protein